MTGQLFAHGLGGSTDLPIPFTYALIGAACGFDLSGERSEITLDRPSLPEVLRSLDVANLKVGRGTVSLRFNRIDDDVTVAVDNPKRLAQVSIRK